MCHVCGMSHVCVCVTVCVKGRRREVTPVSTGFFVKGAPGVDRKRFFGRVAGVCVNFGVWGGTAARAVAGLARAATWCLE